MSARLAWSLLAPSTRVVPYAPTAVAFGLALVVVAVTGVDAAAASQLPRFRGIALLLAVALVFVFDDPIAEIADASPASRMLRGTVRAAVQILPAAAVWLSVLGLMAARIDAPVAAGRLSLEAAGMVLVGWAVAAWWRRARGEWRGGVAAGPGLIVLVVLAHHLPPRLAVFALGPDTLLWQAVERRWLALVGLAAAALALAMRDPLARAGWPARWAGRFDGHRPTTGGTGVWTVRRRC